MKGPSRTSICLIAGTTQFEGERNTEYGNKRKPDGGTPRKGDVYGDLSADSVVSRFRLRGVGRYKRTHNGEELNVGGM